MLVVLTLASLGVKFAQIAFRSHGVLTKTWIGLLAEVDQKVGVVPELGDTSVGVKRFGPELERRTLCKRQFERFYESTYGIAIADKSDSPAEKRELSRSSTLLAVSEGRMQRCMLHFPVLR